MILPPGFVTSFWLASTWFVPAFAFSGLALKRYRKASLPGALVAFCGLLMTQPSIFPVPYILAGELSGIPVIGGALLTVFAIPDHILIIVAVSYVVLVS